MFVFQLRYWTPVEWYLHHRKTGILLIIFAISVIWRLAGWYRLQRRYRECLDKIPGPAALPLVGNTIELNLDHEELYQRIMGMRMLWGWREGINKAWVGQHPYVFVSKASTVEAVLSSNRHIDKSADYRFLRPWLGTGLLTSHETAMGRQVFAQNDSNSEYVRAVYTIGNIIQTRQATIWYHPDILFRISPLYEKHQQCIHVLHAFSNKVISERRVEISSNIEGNNIEEGDEVKKKRLAFLDLLIEASRDGALLSNEDIREEVDTFMFEGHDTTSSAVCWTLYLLGCHPEYQERVIDELEQVFAEGDYHRRPTLNDLKSMKYLERCIKEALRLYPSVPLLARRIAEDVQIGKYTVPEGTTAMVIVPMLHRDPEVFPHPEKFDPDRFLAENANGRHPYAFIPFSAGPRNCIGQKFALLEEKVVISGVLRKFRIESAERREDISITAELVIRAKNGLNVRITPR
ncbi:cytochrome P450 4c3 isoform X3 [Diachasmimorpha longicaudata]|uniref:cytochrome P450 4c3 isoform X3 n=1 Tax=Diachasmimorpha longicaudata TaxID=58733 RepID=UPI0030B89934